MRGMLEGRTRIVLPSRPDYGVSEIIIKAIHGFTPLDVLPLIRGVGVPLIGSSTESNCVGPEVITACVSSNLICLWRILAYRQTLVSIVIMFPLHPVVNHLIANVGALHVTLVNAIVDQKFSGIVLHSDNAVIMERHPIHVIGLGLCTCNLAEVQIGLFDDHLQIGSA